MKTIMLLCLVTAGVAYSADDKAHEITIETKKIGDAVHWQPEKIEVCPGEKLKLTVRHDLEGGFDFHGLFIPALKIQEKVDRKKPVTIEKTVPSDLKPGEYKVGCHFHEKHVPATLVVKKPADCKKKS